MTASWEASSHSPALVLERIRVKGIDLVLGQVAVALSEPSRTRAPLQLPADLGIGVGRQAVAGHLLGG
jgi:hypothetical protein